MQKINCTYIPERKKEYYKMNLKEITVYKTYLETIFKTTTVNVNQILFTQLEQITELMELYLYS